MPDRFAGLNGDIGQDDVAFEEGFEDFFRVFGARRSIDDVWNALFISAGGVIHIIDDAIGRCDLGA